MKYLDEYREPGRVRAALAAIRKTVTRPWVLMEICGGQTHAILRHGLDQLLPPEIELVHGPGCPVCVTPLEAIDKALALASDPDVIFATYGDMLRVPGSGRDLYTVRANGGDVRIVYSPLDALKLALDNAHKQVVFFAIGFETTAPANCMSVLQACSLGLKNYSMLVSQVRVPPAMHAILSTPSNQVQAFLAAGHVCTIMGYWEYLPIAESYRAPIVVTGFEPLDISAGILKAVQMLEAGHCSVENEYSRVVTQEGNRPAQAVIQKVLQESDWNWRGIGRIPKSGWVLRPEYAQFDAEKRFQLADIRPSESMLCIAGQILQGMKKPNQCQAFSRQCTPEHPLGATMVSSEGACAAYFHFRRFDKEEGHARRNRIEL
jgi:hydrogenase expression/formation protein HypD